MKMTGFRYLLNMSYIGKNFFGAQRQVSRKKISVDDPNTIQGCLEMGLKRLNPLNNPIIVLSSRTDSGVHAFNSSCHVDLYRYNESFYQPTTITVGLNRFFHSKNIPIRVIRTYLVPNDFHCRYNAISRTYLYRLAVNIDGSSNLTAVLNHIPIEELEKRLNLFSTEFDVNAMKEAANLFLGLHDFRTFMSKQKSEEDCSRPTRRVIEKLDIIEVNPSHYSPYSWPWCANNDCKDYRYFDIYVKSSGFLYKQVRRIVSTLIAVAQGKLTTNDINFMLQVPSAQSWFDKIKLVSAHGLYLCQVEYSKSDREQFLERISVVDQQFEYYKLF